MKEKKKYVNLARDSPLNMKEKKMIYLINLKIKTKILL